MYAPCSWGPVFTYGSTIYKRVIRTLNSLPPSSGCCAVVVVVVVVIRCVTLQNQKERKKERGKITKLRKVKKKTPSKKEK